MRSHRLRTTSIAIAATLILLTAGSPTVLAQNQSVYAIRDARIYPVSGPMIASGTVVIRDGLIEAVGAGVMIPPEATVIDGADLTVFPGLIDSFGDIGTAEAAP